MYNFNEIIDRNGSGCVKYDALEDFFGRGGLTPLWVADMDWETPDFIRKALLERLSHPIYGYGTIPAEYFSTISGWIRSLHGWEVDPAHIRYIPGIVKGIAFAERCFLNPGDKVIIQTPVYHPFRLVTEGCGFEPVFNPLLPVYDSDGFVCGYEMDFDGLGKLIDDRCRMLVLSNPQNPSGVCWSRETLARLASICHARGIMVVSDEIHCEMAFDGHVPYASASPEAAGNSITFMAPSKTFNIAGIVSSYCIVPDSKVREKFFSWLESAELDSPSIFSVVATMAAYTKGDAWRREMLAYLKENIDFVDAFLRARIPQIRAMRPQASFLIWLDCRKLALPQEKLVSLFTDGAGLALNDGSMFGAEGTGFMRLNAGCPRQVLSESLESLEKAVKNQNIL